MKRIIIALLGGGALALGASAAPVSPAEALARALAEGPMKVSAKGGKGAMRFAFEKKAGGEAAVYVFNRGEADGFMVLPADDAAPAVLGYADKGNVPASESDMPEGIRYWINTLAEQVAWSRTHQPEATEDTPVGTPLRMARPDRDPIEPLCKTQWNQDAPYNNRAGYLNKQRCYTGCVATAMAQAMKYHNWPEKGTGSHTYDWRKGGTQLSMDFGATTFDWANMKDSYASSYTSEEANAVATLMRACGISVDMDYGLDGSGAISNKIPVALGTYFSYDKSIRFEDRDNYGLIDWEDMIYNSLKTYGPVIYNGQSYQGGHSFICDGYSRDGYFHFNWGWGGLSDGYFLLDALDPLNQGIGGSLSGTGFDFMQDVVLDIRPDRTGNSEWSYQMAYSDFVLETGRTYSLGEEIPATGTFYCVGPGAIPENTIFAMVFTDVHGQHFASAFSTSGTIQPAYGFRDLSYPTPENLEDGTYTLRPAFMLPVNGEPGVGEWTFGRLPITGPQNYVATVKSGKFTIEEGPMARAEGEITSHTSIERDKEFTIELTVTNPSDIPFYSLVSGCLVSNNKIVASGLDVPMDVAPNDSEKFTYVSMLQTSDGSKIKDGVYDFHMAYTRAGQYYTMTAPLKVTIGVPASAVNVAVEDDAPVEYYNLQGVRVEPAPGQVLIRRQGVKAEKIRF